VVRVADRDLEDVATRLADEIASVRANAMGEMRTESEDKRGPSILAALDDAVESDGRGYWASE